VFINQLKDIELYHNLLFIHTQEIYLDIDIITTIIIVDIFNK
jgi:hypothetical protein